MRGLMLCMACQRLPGIEPMHYSNAIKKTARERAGRYGIDLAERKGI